MKSVEEIMSLAVNTLESNISVSEAAKLMFSQDLGSVVVTEYGELVGIATELDFVRVLAKGLDAANTALEEIMSEPLISVDHKASVADAARLMSEKHIRRLPVIKDKALVGIVTASDVIRHLGNTNL